MNEYDRLYRQAQRYREMYPEGTRILLLHMGADPRPVEDDMRGTVKYVDDMLSRSAAPVRYCWENPCRTNSRCSTITTTTS